MKEFRKFQSAVKAENVSDDGYKVRGYASVFNGVDSDGDTILQGAFTNALSKSMPKMFFNHDSWSVPIGKWTECKQDEKGLWVEGELTKGNSKAAQVAAALKHGTVDGMSIGFLVNYESIEENAETGGYIIKEIDTLREVSIVTFPADDSARIEKCEGIKSVRDLESLLRDEGGFSAKEAKAIISRSKAIGVAEENKKRDAERSEKLLNKALADLKKIRESIH